MKDLQEILEKTAQFTQDSPLNLVLDNLSIYEPPLVGLASAQDPLFEQLKEPEMMGSSHLTPEEWLPKAKTVIVYFLPYTAPIREANRRTKELPAQEWLYGRYEGEVFNNALRKFLLKEVEGAGGKAVAPVLDARFKSSDFTSNWSERHAAFIAGLGTFSLSKSLITAKGCAGRLGSVITNLPYEPTPRPYQEITQYCSQCGVCIKRCPADAISKKGKEHPPCAHFLDQVVLPQFSPRYGCGKCQTAVPCEDKIPVKKY